MKQLSFKYNPAAEVGGWSLQKWLDEDVLPS